MLTHFKDFNFSSLLIYFNLFHIFFINSFDCYFLAILYMGGKLDESELTFAQVIIKCVKGKHVVMTKSTSKMLNPLLLQCFLLKVEQAALVWWQYNFNWIQIAVLTLTELHINFFNKSTYQWMHHSMWLTFFNVFFVPIAIKFISSQETPMKFVSICFGFQQAWALKFYIIMDMGFVITKSLQKLLWLLFYVSWARPTWILREWCFRCLGWTIILKNKASSDAIVRVLLAHAVVWMLLVV